ncbi:hypothetical protein R1flu_010243 [Riccia fluitans]|uniref:Uncharacterized protein n=1 Tax=Riccia fluitans TaxID=41844 RepID=A0ABD1Z4F1_9MARC
MFHPQVDIEEKLTSDLRYLRPGFEGFFDGWWRHVEILEKKGRLYRVKFADMEEGEEKVWLKLSQLRLRTKKAVSVECGILVTSGRDVAVAGLNSGSSKGFRFLPEALYDARITRVTKPPQPHPRYSCTCKFVVRLYSVGEDEDPCSQERKWHSVKSSDLDVSMSNIRLLRRLGDFVTLEEVLKAHLNETQIVGNWSVNDIYLSNVSLTYEDDPSFADTPLPFPGSVQFEIDKNRRGKEVRDGFNPEKHAAPAPVLGARNVSCANCNGLVPCSDHRGGGAAELSGFATSNQLRTKARAPDRENARSRRDQDLGGSGRKTDRDLEETPVNRLKQRDSAQLSRPLHENPSEEITSGKVDKGRVAEADDDDDEEDDYNFGPRMRPHRYLTRRRCRSPDEGKEKKDTRRKPSRKSQMIIDPDSSSSSEASSDYEVAEDSVSVDGSSDGDQTRRKRATTTFRRNTRDAPNSNGKVAAEKYRKKERSLWTTNRPVRKAAKKEEERRHVESAVGRRRKEDSSISSPSQGAEKFQRPHDNSNGRKDPPEGETRGRSSFSSREDEDEEGSPTNKKRDHHEQQVEFASKHQHAQEKIAEKLLQPTRRKRGRPRKDTSIRITDIKVTNQQQQPRPGGRPVKKSSRFSNDSSVRRTIPTRMSQREKESNPKAKTSSEFKTSVIIDLDDYSSDDKEESAPPVAKAKVKIEVEVPVKTATAPLVGVDLPSERLNGETRTRESNDGSDKISSPEIHEDGPEKSNSSERLDVLEADDTNPETPREEKKSSSSGSCPDSKQAKAASTFKQRPLYLDVLGDDSGVDARVADVEQVDNPSEDNREPVPVPKSDATVSGFK